jgi:hypothetical protein
MSLSTSLVMVQNNSIFSRSVIEWCWKIKGQIDFGNLRPSETGSKGERIQKT